MPLERVAISSLGMPRSALTQQVGFSSGLKPTGTVLGLESKICRKVRTELQDWLGVRDEVTRRLMRRRWTDSKGQSVVLGFKESRTTQSSAVSSCPHLFVVSRSQAKRGFIVIIACVKPLV